MAFARASAMRSGFSRLRFPRQPRRTPFGRSNGVSRRGYASEHGAGHEGGGVKSDLPWLVGAVAVTVPSTYLILANGTTDASHKEPGDEWHGEHDDEEGGDEGGDEGGEEGGEEDDDKGGEEGSGEGSDEGDGNGGEQEGGEEKAEAKSEDKGDDKPERGDDSGDKEGDDKPEGGDDSSGKGGDDGGDGGDGGQGESGGQNQDQKDSSGDNKASADSGKQESKGQEEQDSGAKKRDPMGASRRKIENPNARSLNTGADDPMAKDQLKDSMGAKQKGLSNTDTKHSTDMGNMRGSVKGEGTPETAKIQGTVNPGRKQV